MYNNNTNFTVILQGDWGGPLICTMYDTTEGKHVYTLHGVAIGGDSPCSGNEPTVFTRVSTLNEWIVSTITGHTPDQGQLRRVSDELCCFRLSCSVRLFLAHVMERYYHVIMHKLITGHSMILNITV